MAKKQDFQSKVQKQSKLGNVCPTCEATYSYIKMVDAMQSEKSGHWKFGSRNVKVCKCNEKEIYS